MFFPTHFNIQIECFIIFYFYFHNNFIDFSLIQLENNYTYEYCMHNIFEGEILVWLNILLQILIRLWSDFFPMQNIFQWSYINAFLNEKFHIYLFSYYFHIILFSCSIYDKKKKMHLVYYYREKWDAKIWWKCWFFLFFSSWIFCLSWHLIMRKICMQHLELLLWKSTLMDFCNYISTYTKSPIWKSVNSRTTVGGDWAFGFRFARSWMELEFKTVKQDLLAHCIWTESFHTFLC